MVAHWDQNRATLDNTALLVKYLYPYSSCETWWWYHHSLGPFCWIWARTTRSHWWNNEFWFMLTNCNGKCQDFWISRKSSSYDKTAMQRALVVIPNNSLGPCPHSAFLWLRSTAYLQWLSQIPVPGLFMVKRGTIFSRNPVRPYRETISPAELLCNPLSPSHYYYYQHILSGWFTPRNGLLWSLLSSMSLGHTHSC